LALFGCSGNDLLGKVIQVCLQIFEISKFS
jgi:hypothetical protein